MCCMPKEKNYKISTGNGKLMRKKLILKCQVSITLQKSTCKKKNHQILLDMHSIVNSVQRACLHFIPQVPLS